MEKARSEPVSKKPSKKHEQITNMCRSWWGFGGDSFRFCVGIREDSWGFVGIRLECGTREHDDIGCADKET